MLIPYEEFRQRADEFRSAIARACAAAGRAASEVEILPVTKTHPPEAVAYVSRYGLGAVGENRVQEAVEKQARTSATVRWELIGHLQSNKAALAARRFDRIQSVDSEKLAALLDRAAQSLGKALPILIQVNAGRDPAKFGVEIEDAPRVLEGALARPRLIVQGLMAIAPLSPDPAVAVRAFQRLRELRDGLSGSFGVPLPVLSMGMTGDFAAAIAAGSTLVRIGTALFGRRE